MKDFWVKNRGLIGFIAVIFIVAVVGGLAGYSIEEIIEPSLTDYEQAKNSTVILLGGHSLASGVIISPDGYVLSCAHGGIPEAVYSLEYYDDMDMPLIVKRDVITIYHDRGLDLSIHKIVDWENPDRVWAYSPLSADIVEIGEDVFSIGCPLGGAYYISWGKIISEKFSWDIGEAYWLHSCSANQGNSGGPLFNMKGEIIGINVYLYGALPTMAGYVPLIDGCLAIQVSDFIPAIEGIIATHRLLQLQLDEHAIADKRIKNLNRSRPD